MPSCAPAWSDSSCAAAVAGLAVRDPRRAPEEHEGRALVGLARVVAEGADDHVGVAVAVHVARPGHAAAELRIRLVRLELRARRVAGFPSAIPEALPRNTKAAPSSVSPAS